ncbi:MAG: hypothetical protein K6F05_02145 [Succinivibrio sp.]|nr:hypothetical protein [Succinivibrio sp.]
MSEDISNNHINEPALIVEENAENQIEAEDLLNRAFVQDDAEQDVQDAMQAGVNMALADADKNDIPDELNNAVLDISAEQLEEIEIKPLKEAIQHPVSAAQRILSDPQSITTEIEKTLEVKKSRFSFFETLGVILTFGIAYPFIKTNHELADAIEMRRANIEANGIKDLTRNLHRALQSFPDQQNFKQEFSCNGNRFVLTQNQDNVLFASFFDGDNEVIVRLPLTATQLKQQLENDVTLHARIYGKDQVREILNSYDNREQFALPAAAQPADAAAALEAQGEADGQAVQQTSRYRTLLTNVITGASNHTTVEFSEIPTEVLRLHSNTVLSNLNNKQRATDKVSDLLTHYQNSFVKSDKINSILTSELLAKLDEEPKPEQKADIKNIELNQQQKIKQQREEQQAKVQQVASYVKEKRDYFATSYSDAQKTQHEVNCYKDASRLAQKLYAMQPGEGSESALTLAGIAREEAKTLAELTQNRILINSLKEPAGSVILKLVKFCSSKKCTTEASIRELFTEPSRKIVIDLGFFKKELENAQFNQFVETMQAELGGLEQEILDSPFHQGQLLCGKLFSELCAREPATLEHLTDLLDQNQETLKALYQDKTALDSLPAVLRNLINALGTADPAFEPPLTYSANECQPILDLVDTYKLADKLMQPNADIDDLAAGIKNYFELLEQNSELFIRLSDKNYGRQLLEALPYMSAEHDFAFRQLLFEANFNFGTDDRVTQGIPPELLPKIIEFSKADPKPKEEDLNGNDKLAARNLRYLTSGAQTLHYGRVLLKLEHKFKEVMKERQSEGYKPMNLASLKEVIGSDPEFAKILACCFKKDPQDILSSFQDCFIGNMVRLIGKAVLQIVGVTQHNKMDAEMLGEAITKIVTEDSERNDDILSITADGFIAPEDNRVSGMGAQFLSEGCLKHLGELEVTTGESLSFYGSMINEYLLEQENVAELEKEQAAFEENLQGEKVHNFLAELILNFDGSKYDSEVDNPQSKPGTRLVKTMLEHVKTFNRIISDPAALKTLPEQLRGQFSDAIGNLRGSLLLTQLEQSEFFEQFEKHMTEPTGAQLLTQLQGSELFTKVQPQDPPTSDDYTNMVLLSIRDKLLPADAVGRLISELLEQKLITENDAKVCFNSASEIYDENEKVSYSAPFSGLDTSYDAAFEEIIKQQLLPIQMLQNLASVAEEKGLLKQTTQEEILNFARESYGEAQPKISQPFMLAEPDSIALGIQESVLKQKLEDALKNPEDEMWEYFAAAETQLNSAIAQASEQISATISTHFNEALNSANANHPPLDPTDKNVTLKQLQDEVTGDFAKSALGRFMGHVMSSYFKDMSTVDKRAMLSSLVRYSNHKSTQGQILGALFKGAGPIMQKMLQRLPAQALSDDLREAVADMKCNLAPIPQRIIQAHLLELVNSSNHEISKISVVKSLGAASVGQAVLCRFYTKEHPEGIDKVVKFLRPDVQNRVEREQKVFLEAAKKVPGMDVTFKGDLKSIMEELDLTVEARNVLSGQIYSQDNPEVKSMTLSDLALPTTDVMVIDLAPGTTLDGRLKEVDQKVKDLLMPFTHYDDPARHRKAELTAYTGEVDYDLLKNPFDVCIKTYGELSQIYHSLLKQQEHLISFTKNWVTEGIFGTGFYHGDLHAGNIMTTEDQLTIIDFGNCTQLTEEQQQHITKMMAAAMFSDGSAFTESLIALLSDESKQRLLEHVNPEDPNTPLVGERLKTVIDAVLSKGTRKDSGSRILVALQEVLKLGIEMPAPIYNFSKCQMALNNAIDETNKTLTSVYNAMRTVSINVKKVDDDPAILMLHAIGGIQSTNVELVLKYIDEHTAHAKERLESEEYRNFVFEMVEGKRPIDTLDNSLTPYLERNNELKAQYEEYQQHVARKKEITAALKQPDLTEDSRQILETEMQNVTQSANLLFTSFFITYKAEAARALDEIANTARQSAKGCKNYDDFLDCMGEVLDAKRSEALSSLGMGKSIQYAIPMAIDQIFG